MSKQEFIRECADMALAWLNQACAMLEWGESPNEVAQTASREIARFFDETWMRGRVSRNRFIEAMESVLEPYNQDEVPQSAPCKIVAARIVKKVVATYHVPIESHIRSLAIKRRLHHPEIFNVSR